MLATAAVLIVAIALLLARVFAGPSVYDRILALNAFATKTIMILGVLGAVSGQGWFIDIAFLYVLVNFVATIAIMKYVRYGSLRPALYSEHKDTHVS